MFGETVRRCCTKDVYVFVEVSDVAADKVATRFGKEESLQESPQAKLGGLHCMYI